ncbi:nuclear pore complex protein Nup160-like [Elysia marginata]|uniref:Nuclear pore complex protein Nup160-like n=1 Tax=Elysia marginata TaxID=1093978 RepID=A0AAV4EZA2_9GAST|nr:nuclear pore complex protein Nup160-like [Elysia marginata]
MFREVTAPASNSSRWKSITICTGASASTLQDIKVPESCGGYSYLDSGLAASGVRNRFIYWRTYQDVLELVEESMDTTLSGNMVRYRFQDSPILPGVSIHEVRGNVVVLVPTVASIHRLVFPHPSQMVRQQTFVLTEQVTSSIFYDVSMPDDPRNQYLLAPGGSINAQLVRAASCVQEDGHTLFAVATTTGTILLVTMPPLGVNGTILQQEMSCSSVMKKLWNGLIPGNMRGGQPAGESAVSLDFVFLGSDVYIFTACRDFRMRVWSTKTKECVLVENLLDFTSKEAEDAGNPVSYSGSGHVLKTILGGNPGNVCVFLSLQNQAKFVFLSPVIKNNRLKMEHLTTLDKSPLEDLVDFVVTEEFLLSLWTTQTGDTQVLAVPLAQQDRNQVLEWESVHLSQELDQVVVPQNRDPREFFLAKIFSPGLFSAQDIIRALSVYRRCAAPAVESEAFFNMAALREEVTNAVDTEIRNSVSDYEIQEEEYVDIQREQWEKLYSCCCQYNQVGGKPKGLFADPITGLFGIIKKVSLLTFCVL